MCFPLDWIKSMLILAVVVVAVIGILQLLIPFVIKRLGIALGEGWAIIVSAFRILMWALIAIAVILICYEMIACLISFAGWPRLRP